MFVVGTQFDFHHARVDRVFARIQRRDPDAFVADVHQVAVLELHAAHVLMRRPDERDDHADMADGNLHHRHLLHLDEPGVQVPRAGQQDLFLQSAPAAAFQKRLRVLEVVVAGDDRPGDFARSQSAGHPAW